MEDLGCSSNVNHHDRQEEKHGMFPYLTLVSSCFLSLSGCGVPIKTSFELIDFLFLKTSIPVIEPPSAL